MIRQLRSLPGRSARAAGHATALPSPRRSSLLPPALAAAAIGIGACLGQTLISAAIDSLLPDASRITSFSRPGTLTVLDTHGQVVFKKGPATREKLPSGRMPQLIQRAFVAAEDRRFYEHDGVDLLGILRALLRNVSQGSVEEGASTITQQLARTVFLSQDRTLWRKLKEALLAGKIERQLSKGQILEQYLNYVYLGSGAYGISDAAWVYFSKPPEQLTLAEVALIAGMPPAPSVYSPLVNPRMARKRRSIVLRRMREAGYIDAAQLQRADLAPLGLKPAEPKFFANPAPWFTSWLEQELPRVLSREQLEMGGLTVRSGLNAQWQIEAQRAINSGAGSMQGALLAIEPGTGLVRAMVGGKDWQESQFNRATQALRSPGSTFKLFTYIAALQSGIKPEDLISSRARCYLDGWPAKRFCIQGTPGTFTLTQALTRSVNAAAVNLAERVGFPRVIGVARDLGITGPIGSYPSMVLGANEKTMLEMVAAYSAVNNRGVWIRPIPFEEIYGPDGELLWSRRLDGPRPRRAISSDIADALMWMLQSVVRNGTGYAATLPDRPVAGKTGTAEGARDLWFIGSIPQLTTGVWLGYDENLKTGSSSAQAAATWALFMKRVIRDVPVQPFPPKPLLQGSYQPTTPRRPPPGEPLDGSLPPSYEPAPYRSWWTPRWRPSRSAPPPPQGAGLPPAADPPATEAVAPAVQNLKPPETPAVQAPVAPPVAPVSPAPLVAPPSP